MHIPFVQLVETDSTGLEGVGGGRDIGFELPFVLLTCEGVGRGLCSVVCPRKQNSERSAGLVWGQPAAATL